ncbi:AraC family transcriptional regulator [Bradyrhizobium sp. CB1650]|uniref:helix-turn-helix transcriptional regulator n=1 Tax=Bradyrhizobium sp. CB1650 TaxID=3039153 RepID=UPI0024360F16|nr:AraC family transcriptional regulator [Bradyrhizobium sp. CB1650]WGD53124.1 AraC family transcriptional regulator [Bradyrhizobium sp. CB1650]
MNKHILPDSFEDASVAPEACQVAPVNAEHLHASAEMARVLETTPFHMALDSSGAGIAHWKHDPLHVAADAMDDNGALDTLFRCQLMDFLAKHLLAAHVGTPSTFQPSRGGLSPTVLRRAIARLGSDSDTDVSLAALASDAGLSRFHFCRAFKESTGLSPHAWRRQQRLREAKNMLRDTDASVISIAVALGYSSQAAFAAAFRKLTGETPRDWRRRMR